MPKVRSLRITLALWLVPAGLLVFVMSIWLSQSAIARLADSAYDRTLAGALRAIEANLMVRQGGLGFDLPYELFANLQATSDGTVYFRILTDDGLVNIGDPRLPLPPRTPTGVARFYDADYLGQAIRVGAIQSRLPAPLYGAAEAQAVTIAVAETTAPRDMFLGRIARLAFWRDAAALLVALAVLAVGTGVALRPLSRLRERFDLRHPDDLSPVDPAELPAEVRPLVLSFNALLERHVQQAEARKRFLDDASHQLRTPISVLRMQLDYALAHPEEREETIAAMRAVLDRTTHSTAQLLALARVESGTAPMAPADLCALLRGAAVLHLAPSRRKRLTLDLDVPEVPLMATVAETLLHEAVSNLLDNAIRLSPEGAVVEVVLRPSDGLDIVVADRGPGMDPAILARVGERFLTSGGHGLGLSFGQAVARMHGGVLRAENRAGGGFAVTLHLPRSVLKAS